MRDMSKEKIRPKDGCIVEALKDVDFTHETTPEREREKNMSLLLHCFLHATTCKPPVKALWSH